MLQFKPVRSQNFYINCTSLPENLPQTHNSHQMVEAESQFLWPLVQEYREEDLKFYGGQYMTETLLRARDESNYK